MLSASVQLILDAFEHAKYKLTYTIQLLLKLNYWTIESNFSQISANLGMIDQAGY